MSDQRMITDFFRQEAPDIAIPDNWANIKTDTILQMYHFMCDMLFGVGDFTDSNGQLTRAACIVKLHKLLCGLFGDILQNEKTFTYKDLLLPDPARARFFMVHLIRFYIFKCERQAEVDNVISEMEDRRRDVDNEKAFEQNILQQMESAQEMLSNLRTKSCELDGKCYAVERELADMIGKRDEMLAQFQEKSNYEKELQAKLEALQLIIHEANDKSKRLDSNIVTSPDRFTKELESNEVELANVLAKKDDYLKELRRLERGCNDQQLGMQLLERCDTDINDLLAVQATVSESRRATDEARHIAKDAETRARQTAQAAADRLAQNEARERELLSQCESSKQHVEVIRTEAVNLESDAKSLADLQKESQKELRIVVNEVRKRNNDIVALGERFDADVAKLRDIETQLSRKADEEVQTLQKVYQSARALFDAGSV